jgi:protein-tyrosine phosphatase
MTIVMQRDRIRILFVCLGNICRSPTAEGVFRHLVEEARLADRFVMDSAGTGDYHMGLPPDERASEAAARRGYDLSGLRARQVNRRDFAEFDYILAMDEQNVRMLKRLAPAEHAHKVKLFTEFSSRPTRAVPDPYAGGPEGFELVLDLVEDAARGLLRDVRRRLT